jgi:hypothetical protein
MFNWRVNLTLFLLFSLVFFGTVRLFYITYADREEYAELLKSSEPEEETEAERVAKQQRGAVHKEIWFVEHGNRLYSSLRSAHSELIIADNGVEREMVENLSGVSSYMQEELFYKLPDGREAVPQENGMLLLRRADPGLSASWIDQRTPGLKPMQVIRFLQAEHGTYHYTSNRFVAQEVNVLSFLADGHELVENVADHKLIMKGIAKTVILRFSGKNINFEAQHLKATFFTTRGMM